MDDFMSTKYSKLNREGRQLMPGLNKYSENVTYYLIYVQYNSKVFRKTGIIRFYEGDLVKIQESKGIRQMPIN